LIRFQYLVHLEGSDAGQFIIREKPESSDLYSSSVEDDSPQVAYNFTLEELSSLFNFTREDLIKNRQGILTNRQKFLLTYQLQYMSIFFLVAFVIFLILYLFFSMLLPNQVPEYEGGFLFNSLKLTCVVTTLGLLAVSVFTSARFMLPTSVKSIHHYLTQDSIKVRRRRAYIRLNSEVEVSIGKAQVDQLILRLPCSLLLHYETATTFRYIVAAEPLHNLDRDNPAPPRYTIPA
jgi:hypothetical protein